jgi:hypothetical protein
MPDLAEDDHLDREDQLDRGDRPEVDLLNRADQGEENADQGEENNVEDITMSEPTNRVSGD